MIIQKCTNTFNVKSKITIRVKSKGGTIRHIKLHFLPKILHFLI